MEGKLIRLFYYACIILIFAGCNPPTCNPKNSNLAIVLNWDVPAGQTYTFTNPEEGLNSVDFKARVFFPAKDSSGTVLTDGKHPLVIFGHGRYGPHAGSGYPNNYLHAAYLMKHLASWGYVCVTVNFDVVNSLYTGIRPRGELFLKAIDYMAAQNSNPSSMFYNKIDMDHIGIIGHSRGGGGAISAVLQNQAQGNTRKIKALATISPTDYDVTPITGMPQLMIYGTWDGDLSDAPGYGIWDGSGRDKTKLYVELYGANHFYFSDDLEYASNEIHGISRENHQNIAKGFINAFFDQYVRDSLRYSWPQYLTYEKKVDTVDYFIQYQNQSFLSIDNGGTATGSPTTNTMGGSNVGTSLTLFDDSNLGSGTGQYGNTFGLRIGWDAASDAVTFNIPVTNASAYTYISFRAAQRHGQAGNTLNTFKNLKVKITDNLGNSMTVPIVNTIYPKGLQYPDLEEYPGGTGGYKNIPSTFRLPLSAFTTVNKSQIKSVAILFDAPNTAGFVNNTGNITFDDLEFTN